MRYDLHGVTLVSGRGCSWVGAGGTDGMQAKSRLCAKPLTLILFLAPLRGLCRESLFEPLAQP